MDTITDFKTLLATNSSAVTFATRGYLFAAPTTVNRPGLISTSNFCNAGQAPRAMEFIPFGLGAADGTLEIKVNRLVRLHSSNADEWVEPQIAYLTCTRCATVGSSDAGATLSTDNKFCDAITVTAGNSNVSVEAVGPGNDDIASFIVDMRNSKHLEVLFKSSTNGASGNCLYRPIYEP